MLWCQSNNLNTSKHLSKPTSRELCARLLLRFPVYFAPTGLSDARNLAFDGWTGLEWEGLPRKVSEYVVGNTNPWSGLVQKRDAPVSDKICSFLGMLATNPDEIERTDKHFVSAGQMLLLDHALADCSFQTDPAGAAPRCVAYPEAIRAEVPAA